MVQEAGEGVMAPPSRIGRWVRAWLLLTAILMILGGCHAAQQAPTGGIDTAISTSP